MQRIVRDDDGDGQGILYGQAGDAGTVVRSSRALTVFGIEEMAKSIAEAHDPVVGYYRIREANSLELTTDEVNLAETLFARPGSVVLLIERRAGCPKGNFFFMEHGSFLNLPLLEFPLDAATLTEREAQRLKRTDAKAVIPAAHELPPPSSVSSSPLPSAHGKPVSARRPGTLLWMLAMALSIAIVFTSVALFILRPRNRIDNEGVARSTRLEARTSLRAERQGEDLKFMWDLKSPAVASATSGILDIDDGGTTRRILMTADQVRFGSLLYSPTSEQISVRLTTLKDDQSTEQESVLVLLNRPPQPQPQPGKSQQIAPRIPFEVKTERLPPTHAFVPPADNLQIKSPVQLEDPPAVQTGVGRVDPPAPQPSGSGSPPQSTAVPKSEPAKLAIQTSPGRVDPPAPSGSGSPPQVTAVPKSEPAKPAAQTSPERVDPPAQRPLGSGSPPQVTAVPKSEPAKPAAQASPQRVDPPAQRPLGSGSSQQTTAVPKSEPAKPLEEGYAAPVLIDQAGARTPPELVPFLKRPVAVSVRADINEAGRVTRAEAIAEKGIHVLLLRAATDAAWWCRFRPARQGQSPVASTVTIVFHFGPRNPGQ